MLKSGVEKEAKVFTKRSVPSEFRSITTPSGTESTDHRTRSYTTLLEDTASDPALPNIDVLSCHFTCKAMTSYQPTNTSPFFYLPSEIRQQIFKEVFYNSGIS